MKKLSGIVLAMAISVTALAFAQQSESGRSNAEESDTQGWGCPMGGRMMSGYSTGMMGGGMMGGGMMRGGMMGRGMMGGGMMGRGMMGRRGGSGMMGRRSSRARLSEPVTKEHAQEMAENYLASTGNPYLKVGKVEDKGDFFEVEIVTKKEGALVSKITVDKATGWMQPKTQ